MCINWSRIGAVFGLLFVAIGAFGAHALKARLLETGYAAQFETGVHYHAFHALALFALPLVIPAGRTRTIAGWGFALGILLFSGSLYLLGMSGVKWLGAVTPFGGVAFIVGWAAAIAGAACRRD